MGEKSDIQRVTYQPGLTISFLRPPTKAQAAILFFHGGGWVGGDPMAFSDLWPPLLLAGNVCATAEYRVKNLKSATIYDCISNAKAAAVCFANIFPGLPKFLCGASAGGTLALLAATENCRGCILFNPVLDLSADGFRNVMTPSGGDESISPLHMDHRQFPPTIIMQGDADSVTPVATAKSYAEQSGAELIVFPRTSHGVIRNPLHTERIVETMLRFISRFI